MLLGNLAYERQPKAPAALGFAMACRPVKGLEDAVPVGFRNTFAGIADAEAGGIRVPVDAETHRLRAVAQRILDQVAHEPRDQPSVALYSQSLTGDLQTGGSRFFRSDCK